MWHDMTRGLAMMAGLAVSLSVVALPAKGATQSAEGDVKQQQTVTLENPYLKMEVTATGTRIVSLVDKLRDGKEQAKSTPFAGGIGEIRFNQSLGVNDNKTVYRLSRNGDTITGVASAVPDEDTPYNAIVTKRYTLHPDASRITATLTIQSQDQQQIALIPWLRHLLFRGLEGMPEEAHMDEMGAFLFRTPHPSLPGEKNISDKHFFPAGNWSSRVLEPMDAGSNTLVTVLRPTDMFKVYNWHRSKENFCTQEVIASPIFIEGGQSASWMYDIVITPPVKHVVYASAQLVVGATPHPTGIDPSTKEITLTFASPGKLSGLAVKAELVSVDDPSRVLSTFNAPIGVLTPSATASVAVPVALSDKANATLRLTFMRDGKAFWPGQENDDTQPAMIPLVTVPANQQIVYPSRSGGRGRLRHIPERELAAPQVGQGRWASVFAMPVSERVFLQDSFKADASRPWELEAPANSYESIQLVLTPQPEARGRVSLAASDLTGPGGAKVARESINQLLYAHTTIPSRYDAKHPVGDYPEGLLPVDGITLEGRPNVPVVVTYHIPPDAPAGWYEGQVTLTHAGQAITVPVRMRVWNVALPVIHPWCDTPTALKSSASKGVTIKDAQGRPLSREALTRALEDIHLKYRLTPCDSGIVNNLLGLRFEAFEKDMQSFLDRGATKIYLGSIPKLLATHGEAMPKVEAWLEQKGWAKHFYVRPGFDEASPDLAEEIRAVCMKWKAVSRIPIMETYYHDNPTPMYDALDIYTHSVSDRPWVRERMSKGDQFWKVNAFAQYVEAPPWTTYRRFVQFFDYHYTGTYIWTVKNWSTVTMWYSDLWADGGVGNLSAVLMWPHETGILSTLGLEAQRDAIEANLILWLLREQVGKPAQADWSPARKQAHQEASTWLQDHRLSEKIDSADDALALYLKAGRLLSAIQEDAAQAAR